MNALSTVTLGGTTATRNDLMIRCPSCEQRIGPLGCSQRIRCSNCSFDLQEVNGIWTALLPTRERYFGRFASEYESVRASEGRGSDDSGYYLSLPFKDQTGRNQRQWSIRARTYRYLMRKVFPKLTGKWRRKLDILDLGAGNCWLSYRLRSLGHRPVAVDLLTNEFDGLGAARFYRSHIPELFPRFQCELDRLPFGDSQFDCAIFNASFHYSEDYVRTLGEAVRCIRPGGSVIIADTAWYRHDHSGQRMISERQKRFVQQYGFRSDAIPSLEYLTDERLQLLEHWFGILWTVHQPFYGLRWHLRPLLAALRGQREPSRFRIYVAEVRK